MKIVQYPSEVLLTPSVEVDITSRKECDSLVKDLLDAWKDLPGNKAGLAAPQIGINKRAFVIRSWVVFNPTFTPAKQEEVESEGCYSVDEAKTHYKVWRPKYGWATWIDALTLEKREQKLHGMDARIFQHELDHLNGVLCSHK